MVRRDFTTNQDITFNKMMQALYAGDMDEAERYRKEFEELNNN